MLALGSQSSMYRAPQLLYRLEPSRKKVQQVPKLTEVEVYQAAVGLGVHRAPRIEPPCSVTPGGYTLAGQTQILVIAALKGYSSASAW